MKYLKLFESIKEHKNICVDLYNEIGPYYNGTRLGDGNVVDQMHYRELIDRRPKEIQSIKNYKQILDDYLTDLQDEFSYEFSLGDEPMLDGRRLYRINYEFTILKSGYDIFMDVMDESIFDRIKDEYPDQRIFYRFYITTGRSNTQKNYSSSWHQTPHSNVDELKERIKSFVNGNALVYNQLVVKVTFT